MKCHIIRGGCIAMLSLGAAWLPVHADPALDKLIAAGKYKEAIDYAEEKLPTAQRDATVWIQLAKANEALNMPEKALACYLVSWRMNPGDYKSLLGAAGIYNKMNQPENALNMAKKALDLNFTVEASWEYAKACIALDRTAEAKTALEKVIAGDPSNQIANRELGNIYLQEKAWAKALPLLKKTYAAKADAECAFKIGKAYIGTGGFDSAIVYLKYATEKGAAPAGAEIELARAYFGRNDFSGAATRYLKVPADEMEAIDFYNAGVALENNNNLPAARDNFEKAVSRFGAATNKEAILAREKVARSQLERKAANVALRHLEFIVEVDPRGAVVPDIYFLLSETYQALDNGPRAIASLEKAISLDKKNFEAYARLADLYAKNGEPDKAKRTFETMMSLSPNDPGVYLSLGQYNLKAKKYSEALSQFQKSNSLKKSAAAAQGMAIAAFNMNRFDMAGDAAESAIALDPGAWDARVIIGTLFLRDKKYKEAQPHLEYLVEKEPTNLKFKEQLAECYEQIGEKTKLMELDKQIVARSPENVESRLRLAGAADARNDIDAALPLYREILAIQPKNFNALHRLYEIYLKKGNLPEAAQFIARYVEIKSTAEAQRDYGDVLYQLKDFDKALNAYRAALKLDPAIKGFQKRYADIVVAKGQQDEVISALTGVIQSGEADFGTYQTIGMMYQKKSNYRKAIEMYQKALQLDPRSGEVLSALASCQAATGALSDAIISYEQVVMMDTGATKEFRELGDIYYKQNNMAAAAKSYKRYFASAPSDETIAKRLGKFASESQNYQEVIKYLSFLRYRTEEDIEYGMMYATACIAMKKNKDGIQVLETLRGMKSKGRNMGSVLKLLAEAYEKDGQEARSAECYGAYSSLPDVSDPDAAYKHAFMLEKTSPLSAQKAYENNTKRYQNDYRNFLRLGLMLSSNKETLSKAALYLRRTISLADSVPAVWLELAKVYGKLGSEQEEYEAYRKFIQADAQNPEANKRLGIILTRRGEFAEALIFLEIANTITPNDPEIMASLAKGYISSNRKEEAIDLLRKAKVARPNDADVRFQLFDLYQRTGQKDKAKEEIKELLSLKREPKFILQYVKACIVAEDLKSAESAIEDLLATQADNIEALMLKAKIQVLNKKYDEAVETYKEISFIDQNHAASMLERATVYMLQSKLQWAETFYQRALKADPKCALAELGLARIAKLRKDYTAYHQHLDRAKSLDPYNDQILDEEKKGSGG